MGLVIIWTPEELCPKAAFAKLVHHPYVPIVGLAGPVLPRALCLGLSQYSAAQVALIHSHYGRSQVSCSYSGSQSKRLIFTTKQPTMTYTMLSNTRHQQEVKKGSPLRTNFKARK